jgi:hypothetical protein
MTKKYWCPTCGDLEQIASPFPWIRDSHAWRHAVDCSGPFVFIPVVEPLDVPEVTTWGESGGAEALCHWRGPGGWCYTSADVHARIVAGVRR